MRANFFNLIIVGTVALSIGACATQRYGRMTPLSPGERAAYDCDDIALEIEKANFFIEDIRQQRSKTTGAHVLGALGDFGIGNVMEGDAAEQSGIDRLNQLKALEVERGCKGGSTATVPGAASERRYLVSNKTWYGTNDRGRKWVVYFDPSGEVRAKSSSTSRTQRDNGTWEVTADERLCVQFNVWRDGKKRCWQIYSQNGQLNQVGDGDSNWKSGNAENL